MPLGKTFVGLRWVREAVAFYCFVRFTLPETATLQPGWAIGEAILHTTNGSLSWGYQGYRGHGISFVERNTGWAVGAGGATTTGGE